MNELKTIILNQKKKKASSHVQSSCDETSFFLGGLIIIIIIIIFAIWTNLMKDAFHNHIATYFYYYCRIVLFNF